MRRTGRGWGLVARAALPCGLLAAGGCSLLVDRNADECSSTGDCLARGGAFANTYCDSSHGCQASCTTNAQCTDGHTDDPWLCRADHTCARLLSEDCPTILADPADFEGGGVLWLGMLLPLDQATAILSKAKEDAANLARDDFNLVGGLPASGPRRFAFVVCDHSANADRAASHLVNDLRVPGIIGPVYSDTLITVATDVTLPNGVLLLTPSATSTYITDLPGKNDLIWRTCPSDAVQAVAISQLIQTTIEPALRAGVLAGGGALKLANVHKGDAYGDGLGNALEQDLVFNGVSAAANEPANYLGVDYGDPSDPSDVDPAQRYADAVTQVLALHPHVVILVGTQEAITNILVPIEAMWPSALPYRPRYVLSDGAYPRPELLQAVGTSAELRARVLGTAPGTTSPQYTDFQQRYVSTFSDGTQPVLSTAATYDAVYLLAYATAAFQGDPMTGADLVKGLKGVVAPGGTPIGIGTDGIHPGLRVLMTGGQLKLSGTSGPLDFDTATGDTDGDVQIWCLDVDATGAASGFKNSGRFYSASAGQLEGAISCP